MLMGCCFSELQNAIHHKVYVTLGGSVVRYTGTNAVTPVYPNRAENRGSFLHQFGQNSLTANAILELETDGRQMHWRHELQTGFSHHACRHVSRKFQHALRRTSECLDSKYLK